MTGPRLAEWGVLGECRGEGVCWICDGVGFRKRRDSSFSPQPPPILKTHERVMVRALHAGGRRGIEGAVWALGLVST